MSSADHRHSDRLLPVDLNSWFSLPSRSFLRVPHSADLQRIASRGCPWYVSTICYALCAQSSLHYVRPWQPRSGEPPSEQLRFHDFFQTNSPLPSSPPSFVRSCPLQHHCSHAPSSWVHGACRSSGCTAIHALRSSFASGSFCLLYANEPL